MFNSNLIFSTGIPVSAATASLTSSAEVVARGREERVRSRGGLRRERMWRGREGVEPGAGEVVVVEGEGLLGLRGRRGGGRWVGRRGRVYCGGLVVCDGGGKGGWRGGETYGRRRRISARVLDVVGRDLGGLGVEEGEEGFRKGDFGGGHFGDGRRESDWAETLRAVLILGCREVAVYDCGSDGGGCCREDGVFDVRALWWVKGGVVKLGSVRQNIHSPNPGFACLRCDCWATGRSCLNSSPPCEDVSRQAMRGLWSQAALSCCLQDPQEQDVSRQGPSLSASGTRPDFFSHRPRHPSPQLQVKYMPQQIESPDTQRQANRAAGIAKPNVYS